MPCYDNDVLHMIWTDTSLWITFIRVVCRVNEYVASGACVSCPTNSTSPGGTPNLCNCNSGTGRVDDSDVSLPCFGE